MGKPHRWVILVAFEVTDVEVSAYLGPLDIRPADLLERDPHWGEPGCLDCLLTVEQVGDYPCSGEEAPVGSRMGIPR